MSGANLDQYRHIAEQLIERANQDQQFSEQAKANPLAALTAAGIPEETAKQMLQGDTAEVSGYMTANCTDTTCYSSACPATCKITIIMW